MRKIYYQPIYNRKKKLNAQGKALLQVEAYLEKRKIYFSTHIYLSPEQWDNKRKLICKHPHAEALNYQVKEFLIQLASKERKEAESGIHAILEYICPFGLKVFRLIILNRLN